MGCMGMSMTDFSQCAPSEFYAAWKAWNEMRQNRERNDWERMQCLCTLQPYSKQRLQPEDIMTFAWEKEKGMDKKTAPALTREELMKRYRAAKEAWGLK